MVWRTEKAVDRKGHLSCFGSIGRNGKGAEDRQDGICKNMEA